MRIVLTLATLGVIAAFFALMYRSWQRRKATTAHWPELPDAPAQPVVTTVAEYGTYLGTVGQAHWLDRIASHGLGGRGPATFVTCTQGLVISRVGQDTPVFIPVESFVGVELSAGIAGRTFGRDSVVVLTWRWHDHLVHTGIRVADDEVRSSLLTELAELCPPKNAEVA